MPATAWQIEEPAPGAALTDAARAVLPASGMEEPAGPDARWLIATDGRRIVARLAWEIADDLQGISGLCGIIGHYEAAEAEAGIALLAQAGRRLLERGARRVLGPMDGSTWGRYRLALRGPDAPPPFSSEPWQPAQYPSHFLRAGFTVAAEYESRIVTALPVERPSMRPLAERVARAGVIVAPIDRSRLREELETLFPLCASAFSTNPYYRPISCPEFVERYRPFKWLLDPEFALIARGPQEEPLAFVLAIPDLQTRPRVILKTLAAAPEVRRLGLGAHLADRLHHVAHEKGYRAVIHAMMHLSNESRRLSARYGSRPFRRYALYERVL
jgi:GNAT superfamily N-acetyltransferase